MNDKQEQQTECNGGGFSNQPKRENDNTFTWVTWFIIAAVIISVILVFL